MNPMLKIAYDYGCRLAVEEMTKQASRLETKALDFLTDSLGAGVVGGVGGGVAGLLNSDEDSRLSGLLSGAAGGAALGSLSRLGQKAVMGPDMSSKLDDLRASKALPAGTLKDNEIQSIIDKRKAHLRDLQASLYVANQATSQHHLREMANARRNKALAHREDWHRTLLDDTRRRNTELSDSIDDAINSPDLDNILRDPDAFSRIVNKPVLEHIRTRPGIVSPSLSNRLRDPDAILGDAVPLRDLTGMSDNDYSKFLQEPSRYELAEAMSRNPLRAAAAGYAPVLSGLLGGLGGSEAADYMENN
jgi:hypothetical protein